MEKRYNPEGVELMAVHMVMQAVDDINEYRRNPGNWRAYLLARSAERWIKGEINSMYSFELICDHLNIPVEDARNRILKGKSLLSENRDDNWDMGATDTQGISKRHFEQMAFSFA